MLNRVQHDENNQHWHYKNTFTRLPHSLQKNSLRNSGGCFVLQQLGLKWRYFTIVNFRVDWKCAAFNWYKYIPLGNSPGLKIAL